MKVVKCICTDIDCNWKHKGEICHDTPSQYQPSHHLSSYDQRHMQRGPMPPVQFNPSHGPRGTWAVQPNDSSPGPDDKINLDNGHWSNPSFYANQPRPTKPRILEYSILYFSTIVHQIH